MSALIISAGGHVYDRMSGTWSEPNERLAKVGKAGEVAGGRAVHGTDGIVGVKVKRPTQPRPSGPAAGIVNPGHGGSGPASPRVTNGVPGKGAAGGSGVGSDGALSGVGHVWWEKAGQLAVPKGSLVLTSDLPPLQSVMKGSNTAIMIGGTAFVPEPGTSDADEIEAMLGDGDNFTEIAWWFKQAAGLTHIDYNVKRWANDPATKQWAEDFDRGVLNAIGWK